MFTATLMLLGSGELGREFTIAAKRLGCRIIACDRYADAPAMQMADASEVFPMLDGKRIRAAVEKHRPHVIVPEIEAIDTATLFELEKEGWRIAPSAKAVQLTMNRDGIREFAARELGLVTSKYRFAESREEAVAAANEVGLPCVIKPVMSSSGKGQSTAATAEEVGSAWDYAVEKMRGDRPRVIVEELIQFDSEITMLTVATKDGVLFCQPIGHRQDLGDYRESWQPAALAEGALFSARNQARKVVTALGGHGIFGVEFFIRGVPGIVDDDRAGFGIVVRPVEAANAKRKAVLALVIVAGRVSAARGRIAAEVVAEPLEKARMLRIGAAAVAHEMALDRAVLKIDHVEARLARGAREIGDSDGVARPHLVLVERGLRTSEQLRIDSDRRGGSLRLRGRGGERVGRAGRGLRDQEARKRLRRGCRREDETSGAGGTKAQHFPPIQ
jgi:phosphoribosylglycinamide formyltransferase 2